MTDAAAELCEEYIGRVLSEAVDRHVVPGVAAAISDRDRTIYSVAYGAARRSEGVALGTHSIFRIASMTKLVTSIAILMLVEERRLNLDAPLSAYLPAYRPPGVLEHFDPGSGSYVTRPAESPVTIRRLLTHTSGYGYWFLDSRLMQLTDASQPELYDAPFLIAEPGTCWTYGTSTDVLGQVIEPVGGLPLPQFFERRIFKPLSMRDTGFRRPADLERLSSIFVRTRQGFDELPLEAAGPAARGGGGLYSTLEDYLKLLRMLLLGGEHRGQRLLRAESCQALAMNQIGALSVERPATALRSRANDFIFMDGTQKFGFGVAVETRDQPSGRKAGSFSWAGILNTYFWVDPSYELAAVICMQVQPFADPACVELYRRFERALYDCLEQA